MGFVIRRWKIGKLTKSEAGSVDQIEGFKVQMQIAASSSDKFLDLAFLVDTVGLNSPIPVIGYQLVAKMKFYTQSGQIVFADWDGTVKGLEPEGSN